MESVPPINRILKLPFSYGKSIINGGFNGKIIYKWAIFHGYVK